MARTLIGELILRFKDQASGRSKKAVQNVEGDLARLQRSAKSMTNLNWGASFQKQLDLLKLSPDEFRSVERGWSQLTTTLKDKNLSKALKSSEIQHWKNRTVAHFAEVRTAIDNTEKRAKRLQRAMSDGLLRPLMVMGGGYTGTYMAGIAGREGLIAASARLREQTRQRMASIPKDEQATISSRARDLSDEFASVNITDIMEMARVARNTMGDTDRGMQVLDQMVAALVTLQTMKGVDAATSEINGLLKALDNLGQNSSGEEGINNVNNIIEAFVRASQIEGEELDLAKSFQFARRSKIAGPGLDAEFFNVAPALMQDMSADTFGAALSSAYQALVIGANSVSSKQNLQNQRDMGIRVGPGKGELKGDELFSTNPYEWVKTILMPALEESGVDMANDAEVAKKVASLSRNTNATGLLTRMVMQSEQIDRLVKLYAGAQGTEGAEDLRYQDPFVGWKALKSAFSNLSAAVGEDTLPTITRGMNSLADTLNSLASSIQDNPLFGYTALGAGAGAAVYGGVKAFKGLTALVTAGPSLQKAALDLTAAAAVLRGGSAADIASGGGKKKGKGGLIAGAAAAVTRHPVALGVTGLLYANHIADKNMTREQRNKIAEDTVMAQPVAPSMSEAEMRHQGSLTQAVSSAKESGAEIKAALSPVAKPTIDKSDILETLNLADQLNAKLNNIGAAGRKARRDLKRQLGSAHTDFQGVSP